MVFEFMAHGDLAELLRTKSTRVGEKCDGQLTRDELVWIAAQIASGMVRGLLKNNACSAVTLTFSCEFGNVAGVSLLTALCA